MRSAVVVLNVFAAIWGAIGLSGFGWPVRVIPALLSVALTLLGTRSPAPPRSAAESARIGRLIGIWTSVEGAAIFATFTLCARFGIPDAAVPMLAIIIGLHFLPLARGIPSPVYYATGPAMIVVGVVGLLIPAADRDAATGLPCALILWASCLALIRRGRRAAIV